MEDAGENKDYIIGWLSSMINAAAEGYPVKGFTIQDEVDAGFKYYTDKAVLAGRMKNLQKVANKSSLEELYA
jgi:hypothetical protein